MKVNKIIKILMLGIIFMILSNIKSYGAVAITKGTSVFTNKTISDFYVICKEMKNVGQGLEGTDVDVHMATNKEWATVSYFSNSNYGTATQGKNNGISVTIDGTDYYSINGNATGVMNWGKRVTYTAGLTDIYGDVETTSTAYENGKSIIQNATDSVHVDLINKVSESSIAKNGWYNSWCDIRNDSRFLYSVRAGLFGISAGTKYANNVNLVQGCEGEANSGVTFRPVILN